MPKRLISSSAGHLPTKNEDQLSVREHGIKSCFLRDRAAHFGLHYATVSRIVNRQVDARNRTPSLCLTPSLCSTVTIDDDEDVYFETKGISGQAELDVRSRVADIVKEVIDSGDWQEEEEDFFEDEEDPGDIVEKDDY